MILHRANVTNNMKKRYTPETVYQVPICPRGNLLYKQIYLITNQKLIYKFIRGFKMATLQVILLYIWLLYNRSLVYVIADLIIKL